MPAYQPSQKSLTTPWDEVREKYETTDATYVSLGVEYDISRFMVSRRAVRENWCKRLGGAPGSREAEAIGVVAQSADQVPFTASPEAVRAGAEAAIGAMAIELESERVEVEHIKVGAASRFDIEDEQRVSTAVTAMHVDTIKRHVSLSQELQGIAATIARRILDAFPDVDVQIADPTGDAAVTAVTRAEIAVRQLVRVSPDAETLAGLLKAAFDGVDRAMLMERRALGIVAPRPGTPNTAALPPQITSPGAVTALAKLDTGAAWKLREMLKEYQRERRAQQISETV